MEARILAGIVLYGLLAKFPKDLVNAYSPAFRTVLSLYRKFQDDISSLQALSSALEAKKASMPDTVYAGARALVDEAMKATPAPGDLLREDYLACKANALLSQYVAGEEVNLEDGLAAILAALPAPDEGDALEDLDDLSEMLAVKPPEGPSSWALPSLNKRSLPPGPGDFLVIGGLPNKGKTSISAFLVLNSLDKATAQKVLWLNNEGPSYEIRLRLRSAITGISKDAMAQDPQGAEAAYQKAKGALSIEVKGIHRWTWLQVLGLVDKAKPDVLVLDMLDHVHYAAAERRDTMLEALYQEARQLAASKGILVVATTQLTHPPKDADVRFPTTGWLKDSKSGKEGAAGSMILIGYDPEDYKLRTLTLVKTKSPKPGPWQTPFYVSFNEQTCQLKEVQ